MIEGLPGGVIAGNVIDWGVGGLSVGMGLYMARLIGSAGKWLIVYFTGRLDKQQEHVDAGMRELVDGLRIEVRRQAERISTLETGLAECTKKHAESEAQVLRLEAVIEALGHGPHKVKGPEG